MTTTTEEEDLDDDDDDDEALPHEETAFQLSLILRLTRGLSATSTGPTLGGRNGIGI